MQHRVALLLAVASLAGCSKAALPSAASFGALAPAGCTGVAVTPGDAASVQRILDRNPPGTTFCFAAGTFRFAMPIAPKSGQRLIGTGSGTVFDGAKIVTGFKRNGSDFVANGFLHGAHLSSRNCIEPQSGCDTPQDVFLDGKPLRRVTSRSALAPGAYYEDFAANHIWLRDNPAGRTIEQAYAPALVESSAGDVTVAGFVVEESASPAQHGAVDASDYRGRGWHIEHDLVRYNHGAGIVVAPAGASQGGSLIANDVVTGNGQEGIAGFGSGHVVSDNEIAGNNRAGYSCYWECGGAKFAGGPGYETKHLTVSGNRIHDNAGDGFWVDINSYDVTFTDNTVVDNWQQLPSSRQRIGSGIFLEISDRAVVTGNDVERNGPDGTAHDWASYYNGAQILMSATANADVYGNHVVGGGGIGMLQQDRTDSCAFGRSHASNYPDGTPVCPYHYRYCRTQGHCVDNDTHWTHDNRIHDNRIEETAPPGYAEAAGLDCDLHHDGPAFAPENANRYSKNTYTLRDVNGAYFSWDNTLNGVGAWRAFGQDAGSRFHGG